MYLFIGVWIQCLGLGSVMYENASSESNLIANVRDTLKGILYRFVGLDDLSFYYVCVIRFFMFMAGDNLCCAYAKMNKHK